MIYIKVNFSYIQPIVCMPKITQINYIGILISILKLVKWTVIIWKWASIRYSNSKVLEMPY